MAKGTRPPKKRTSPLTMLVIAILIVLVGVQLVHLRGQIEQAKGELTGLKSELAAAKQENDSLASALEKADDPAFLQVEVYFMMLAPFVGEEEKAGAGDALLVSFLHYSTHGRESQMNDV